MADQETDGNVTPDELKGLHKVLLGVSAFFFIYLIIEAIIVVPGLFVRYGMH